LSVLEHTRLHTCTVSVAVLLTARPVAWITVHTIAFGDPLSASTPVYVYDDELAPTVTPPFVHMNVSAAVDELDARVTENVALTPKATVALTGWVAIATLENICRRWVFTSITSTPYPGTKATECSSETEPKPAP
jgi:hypothetical protein